jgi:polyphosphate kinase
MARPSLSDPRYYFNRHESWLAFNRRVLEEALDEGNPLLERVKFLAITASNLDEFVEVRVSGLLQQVEHGIRSPAPMDCRRKNNCGASPVNFTGSWKRNTLAGTSSFFPPCGARAYESCR